MEEMAQFKKITILWWLSVEDRIEANEAFVTESSGYFQPRCWNLGNALSAIRCYETPSMAYKQHHR